MKKTILIIVAGFSVANAVAQTFDYLETSKIKVRINTLGELFNDPSTGPSFEVPKGSGNHTFYKANFWVGGEDISSTLHLAAHAGDFNYGPLVVSLATASPTPSIWNRVWKVTAADINFHIANYTTVGYVPSPAIADWPGYGNPIYPLQSNITPFFDNNSDNMYDPMDGDYPLIKGTTAIYQIYNDDTLHASGGAKLGVEIHCMAYVFDCADDSVLSNTIFVNYRVVNHSTNILYNTHMSLWSDPDLGGGMDDFVGCDVSRGLYYSYNGDSIDTDYDSILPVMGVTVLNGPYQDADSIDNLINTNYTTAFATGGVSYSDLGWGFGDIIPDNERMGLRSYNYFVGLGAPNPNMTDPSNAAQCFESMKGNWKDGSPLLYGGYGYSGGTGVTTTQTQYAFFDNSDPYYWATMGAVVAPNWEEGIAGNNAGDRRSLGSMGPFILSPGAYNEIDVAYTFARDYTQFYQPLAALPLLKQRVDSLHSYFNSGMSPCGSFTFNGVHELKTKEDILFDVYPNPVKEYLTLKLDKPDINTNYILYNVVGNLILANTRINGTATIDLSNLPNGVYYLEVKNEGQRSTKKIIVNH